MKNRLFTILTAVMLLLAMMLPTSVSALETTEPLGDADGDGSLTILDATAIQRHLAGLSRLSDSAVQRSMVTGSSELTILDATAIQRRLANLTDRFPAQNIPSPEPQAPTQVEDAISTYEQHVINLVNDIRRDNGLTLLTAAPDLCRIARIKAQDMRDAGYFDHTSPNYGTPFEMLRDFGVTYRTAGENIAYGYRTPQAVVEGWMNSAGHRENILNPNFNRIGVGYIPDGSYWSQLFTD